MAEQSTPRAVQVAGRELALTNLDKVLYPAIGFTKAEVIDYYARIAPTMVHHTRGRCVTLRRWPDGVDGPSFFEKKCPSHRPDWVGTAVGPGRRRGEVRYCLLDEPAAFVWTANLAALELHTPLARADALGTPLACVFDLDPGPGTGVAACAQLALEVRDVLDAAGLRCWAKTSGSKGLQVYVPLNTTGADAHTFEETSNFALAVGSLLEQRAPQRVTTTMARAERSGKVFVDWSQNAFHKTTVCAYSLRARSHPTASTPISWDEVVAGAAGEHPLVFEAADVLERVDRHGDLFAATLEVRQRLPAPRR